MTRALWQFTGMDYIKRKYAISAMTDTQFAEDMNKSIPYEGRPYTMAHVREWRRSLSIPNNAPDNSQKKMQEIADVADSIRADIIGGAERPMQLMDRVMRILELCK